jgi:hypothetical protein
MKEQETLEKIQDPSLRAEIAGILRQHSREAYLERLKRCGVILR